jgi:hypothetical protein
MLPPLRPSSLLHTTEPTFVQSHSTTASSSGPAFHYDFRLRDRWYIQGASISSSIRQRLSEPLQQLPLLSWSPKVLDQTSGPTSTCSGRALLVASESECSSFRGIWGISVIKHRTTSETTSYVRFSGRRGPSSSSSTITLLVAPWLSWSNYSTTSTSIFLCLTHARQTRRFCLRRPTANCSHICS